MIGEKVGHRLDPYLYWIYKQFVGNRGNPNFLSLLGLLSMTGACVLIITDRWTAAGFAIILSGLFDLLDGVIARKLGRATPFGGFLDSVLDRYSDLFLLTALLIFYLREGNFQLVVLTAFVSIGTVLISYARARAEAARVECNVGLMERAERMILLSAGALFQWMVPVLWILAILTHFTVIQRICHVYKRLKQP
jgi:CDP-diacylglycerol--glycerol-3-phosphate 3-phosphatidyltransferase